MGNKILLIVTSTKNYRYASATNAKNFGAA